nr:KAP family NTPase [Streptococcus sp. Marseille-Q6470]
MAEKNFIELDKIDTSTAAQNFANLLNENKTYFLNGTWGSGKSNFLKQVDNLKPVNNKKKVKLVTIDFWRLNDSRSTLETVFANLHPFVYWSLRLIIILCIALSILMTNVVDLGLSVFVPTWVILGAGVVALIVAIHQFLKIKSDGIYSRLLTINCPSFKNKVLVVDDFDRMTLAQQEASYKVFSLLNGKLPIIFVGDIELLHKNDNNYLSKIIDRRFDIPYVLHPMKIWGDYFEQLEERFKIKLSDEFKRVFIRDVKNLRDRERFNDYVNLELIGRDKKEYVQIEQQLVVLYLYLYYQEAYKSLKNGREGIEINSDKMWLIQELQTILFERNDLYPVCYHSNCEAYFINEIPSNRKIDELILIFNNRKQLSTEILNNQQDFFDYIKNFENLTENQQELLFQQTLEFSKLGKNNMLMDSIIQKKVKKEIPDYNPSFISTKMIKDVADFLRYKLSEEDLSEIFYFIIKHKIFQYYDFRNSQIGEELYSKIERFNRKAQILLIYIYSHNIQERFSEWDNELLQKIENLDTEDFLDFLLQIGCIVNSQDYGDEFLTANKTYTTNFNNLAGDTYKTRSVEIFKSFYNRLMKLNNEGYVIKDPE